jgi:hypothetical protein
LPGGIRKNMAFREALYLKIDLSLPNPHTAVWVSDFKDATPFRTEREAQAVKGQVKDALGVSKGMDGLFYVAR